MHFLITEWDAVAGTWQQEYWKVLGVAFTRRRDRLLVMGVARRRRNSSPI